ncbi:alcohol dehydrogenase [Botryosphaeria dothidea]|uniref:Alcohol dehydrogenase n=1 Tax=Botryosphaeria dothidea TaxID=55169 RepID=A0A8H4N5N0_9PEZI|nr:alcohol dehydrogenase [Botryosphaeria dothidea]
MTAVRMYEYDGPEVLKVETHPVPVPGDNQVLIKVKATSVTGWDYVYRNQMVKPIPGRGALPLPQQLGREASGDIALVGKNVRGFAPGDRIVTLVSPACGSCPFCQRGFDNLCIRTDLPAHTSFGGYAEYIVRDQQSILHAPDNLSYDQLACILWSYGTVLNMIDGRAQLCAGESVLITGASGGDGHSGNPAGKVDGRVSDHCAIVCFGEVQKPPRSRS